jgi:DNA mismatch endonuclease (patch repair protein)
MCAATRTDGDSPRPLSDTVSVQMSRMPRRDSGPEIAVRRILHARGLRFRVNHPDLPGRPDVVFTRARIAIFIDGCFWHACPVHGTLPRNNRDWWRAKLDTNLKRDRRKDEELRALGWTPLHYWEHETPEDVADDVVSRWSERIHRPCSD